MKQNKNKMPLKKMLQLHLRALQDIHKISPRLFPAMVADRVVNALKPYLSIYISARIINELAGLRRVNILWFWVLCAIFTTALIALVNAYISYHMNRQYNLYTAKYNTKIFANKMFSMDFADMDKQETHDLRSQIRQNANWMGWGLSRALLLFTNMIKDITGIIGAIALTYSLFTLPIPDTAGMLTVFNHPFFVLLLF